VQFDQCWAVVFGVRWLASALLSSRITAKRQQFESDEKPLPYAATGALQTSSRTFAAQRIELHPVNTRVNDTEGGHGRERVASMAIRCGW
jgi:hypothetical protein